MVDNKEHMTISITGDHNHDVNMPQKAVRELEIRNSNSWSPSSRAILVDSAANLFFYSEFIVLLTK